LNQRSVAALEPDPPKDWAIFTTKAEIKGIPNILPLKAFYGRLPQLPKRTLIRAYWMIAKTSPAFPANCSP
jgi:hypothetical protein